YLHSVEYTLLAIDVPKKNEQSIQAMEQVFVVIQGMHFEPNMHEKWVQGMFQLPFSCEIVSIDGYIQLLMRIPVAWRDVVEGAVYGQYPDAEITEVDDYVNTVPSQWPNETHDMWGVEWTYDNKKNPFLPIKTYKDFQDQFNQIFIDPLGGLLEAMSKIGKGEQIWMHFVCKPLAVNWSASGVALLNDQLGRPNPAPKQPFLDKVVDAPAHIVNELSESILGTKIIPMAGGKKEAGKDDAFGKMWKMSPGERSAIEAMEAKMGRLGYAVKMRYGYFADLRVTKSNKPRGVNAVIGAVKQFNAVGRQGFKPEMKKTATKASYFRVKQRKSYKQRMIVAALKKRSTHIGLGAMTMDTAELATLFHFPSMQLRAPMLKRTDVQKSEAPLNLPFEDHPGFDVESLAPKRKNDPHGHDSHSHDSHSAHDDHGHGEPHLPFADEHGHDDHGHDTSATHDKHEHEEVIEEHGFDYDSDYFEERFAKDKKEFAQSRSAREELLREIVQQESVVSSQKSDELTNQEIKKLENHESKDEHKNEVQLETSNQKLVTSNSHPSSTQPINQSTTSPINEPVSENDNYIIEIIDEFIGHQAKPRERKYIKPTQSQKPVDDEGLIPPNLPFV
ncbi:hypothetical protein IT409_02245, partial [Candidatus Falkowbacteria bacterium]|nr:hypothetical protein [Candidatus Falkowbacteria bacterium]